MPRKMGDSGNGARREEVENEMKEENMEAEAVRRPGAIVLKRQR